ncbi:MAG TPA: hypothetical protein VFW94_13515 [Candidatus Acidoferrales bacterium]|nr:hypothetical protein [Candidatus Acidoferrales bacterium]
MVIRECPFCGKKVSAKAAQCGYCRETLPETRSIKVVATNNGGGSIRRGLLFMMLAALIGYFAGGYSGMKLPVPVLLPALNTYLTPLLFLSGLGLAVRGFYLRHRTLPRHSV